jgi:hypothetical protein
MTAVHQEMVYLWPQHVFHSACEHKGVSSMQKHLEFNVYVVGNFLGQFFMCVGEILFFAKLSQAQAQLS